jgi:DNA-binding transcriptional ArsR family regulator
MDMNKITSEELFALAKQKEADEKKWLAEENKQKIAEVRAERKAILLRQKEEINEINKRITALGGKVAGATATGKGGAGISAAIMGLLEEVEHMDTKAIREKLESLGLSVGNLGQSLAYLKKGGKVDSVERGVYKKAE